MTGVALGIGLLLALIATVVLGSYVFGVLGARITDRWQAPDWFDMWPLAVLIAAVAAVLLLRA